MSLRRDTKEQGATMSIFHNSSHQFIDLRNRGPGPCSKGKDHCKTLIRILKLYGGSFRSLTNLVQEETQIMEELDGKF